MEKYHKIETLYHFDKTIKKFDIDGGFRNENVELLKNNVWIFTEKVDGTNFRIYWDGFDLHFGGRTEKSQFSKDQLKFINENLVTEELATLIEEKFGEKEVYIFGELYGKNIQKFGKLYSEDYGFIAFDVKVNDVYLNYDGAFSLCEGLNLEFVPLLVEGTLQEGIDYVLNNEKSSFSEAPLEGLVGKPLGGFYDREMNRVVVKIKKRDFK